MYVFDNVNLGLYILDSQLMGVYMCFETVCVWVWLASSPITDQRLGELVKETPQANVFSNLCRVSVFGWGENGDGDGKREGKCDFSVFD